MKNQNQVSKNRMIMKNREAEKTRRENEKRYLSSKKKMRILSLCSFLIVVLLVLLFFTNQAAIHNSADDSIEVKFTGFQAVSAGLSGNYKSSDQATFGNISVFYYFVPAEVRTLCLLTTVALFVSIVWGLLSFFSFVTGKQGAFPVIEIVFGAASAGLLFACYAVALSMNDPMVSGYCSGNPACSVRSSAILLALLSAFALALPVLRCVMNRQAKKLVGSI